MKPIPLPRRALGDITAGVVGLPPPEDTRQTESDELEAGFEEVCKAAEERARIGPVIRLGPDIPMPTSKSTLTEAPYPPPSRRHHAGVIELPPIPESPGKSPEQN